MKSTLKSLVCICMFMLGGQLYTQTTAETYQKKAGNFAQAFNGVIEKGYRVGYANTPYYPQEFQSGSFVYRGLKYTDVKMRTDSHAKSLIVLSPDGKFNLVMNPEEVSQIVIGGLPFRYFKVKEAVPGNGYYVVLYEGKDFGIYKQSYVSNINKEYKGSLLYQKFSLKERVLLLKDGKWNVLTNKNSFIKHFKEQKEQLNAYCKEQQLNPGKKNETDWQKLAVYCETLTK